MVSFPRIPPLAFGAVSPRMRARPRGALPEMGRGSPVVPEPLGVRCPGSGRDGQPAIVRERGSAQRRPTSAGPSSNRNFPVTAPRNVPDKRAGNCTCSAARLLPRKDKKEKRGKDSQEEDEEVVFTDSADKGRERWSFRDFVEDRN